MKKVSSFWADKEIKDLFATWLVSFGFGSDGNFFSNNTYVGGILCVSGQ